MCMERFWNKVDKTDNCWRWTGATDGKGYGKLTIADKQVGAHRVSYELLVGAIAPGLRIDHLCRNPPCVNPSHLEPVSHAVNTQRGDNAKLTHDDVVVIKQRLAAGETQRAIGDDFGVSNVCISLIKRGKRWSNVR